MTFDTWSSYTELHANDNVYLKLTLILTYLSNVNSSILITDIDYHLSGYKVR